MVVQIANLDDKKSDSLYFTLIHENDGMVIIDIVVKSVVLLERSSELAISSGESSQDEEYVFIKTGFRKFEKKMCNRFQ